MNFCGEIKNKRLIPAVYQGILRCAIPESGDDFTMYPMQIPNWHEHPVRVLRAAEGFYRLRGSVVAVEAVLSDQRPANWKVRLFYRWGLLVHQFWKMVGQIET